MCGFVGFIDPAGKTASGTLEPVVARMADTLRHRGPDDSGSWSDERAGLAFGHRRLSIVDLSPHGHQPMHSACGRYTIIYNGEIYNFQQLRKELAGPFRGH